MSPARRLSDVVIPGRDIPAKVKIAEILDHDVLLIDFNHVQIFKEVTLEDGSKSNVVDQDYWNVTVDDEGAIKTFSTGAVPIVQNLEVLDKQRDVLPLVAKFSKDGKTYVVS